MSRDDLPGVLGALLAFVVTVLVARSEHWRAGDLAWGMWITSLLTGYGLLLLAIGHGVVAGNGFLQKWAGLDDNASAWAVVAAALFAFLFFSAHFLLFHFVQARFLQGFFFLPGEETSRSGFAATVAATVAAYWPLILVTLALRLRPMLVAVTSVPAAVIALPYRYVARNHIVIFLVAGMQAVDAGAYLLYGLLVVYFFPFDLLSRRRAGG